jgi:phosphonate transport system permease protein
MAPEQASPPRGPRLALLLAVVGSVVALAATPYDLGSLLDPLSWRRAGVFLAALLGADVSPAFLLRVAGLALTTLEIALLGSLLGAALGLLLGMATSRNVLVGDRTGAWGGLLGAALGLLRVGQDALRGVPDFAWAIMAVPLVGLGPLAGIVAIGLNTGGILGRIFSELFDAVPPRIVEPLRQGGASRLQTFLYGLLPLSGAEVLSLALFRTECAVRNASVVGVVGGGGLGSEISLRVEYGEYGKVATLLLVLLLLTLLSDLLSRTIQGRVGPPEGDPAAAFRAGRRRTGVLLLGLLGLTALSTAHVLRGTEVPGGSLALFAPLLRPNLSVLPRALRSALLPLSMAFLATLLSALAAAGAAYYASSRYQLEPRGFTGEPLRRPILGRGLVLLARGVAAVGRGVPDVFWAMLLVSILRLGPLPGMLALAAHSFGLLTRIYAESVDAQETLPLEAAYAVSLSRPKTYLYGSLPGLLPRWAAITFFQFEANVRSAIVLGIVGVGGLGFLFSVEFEFFRFERASVYLLVMVAIALLLDRTSRRLGFLTTRA